MGKLIGFIFGIIIASALHIPTIFGIILGLYIGIRFDRALKRFKHTSMQASDEFFYTTFSVMGYIAKSDGVISQDEIGAARRTMSMLKLTEGQKRQAVSAFQYGKSAKFDLDESIQSLIVNHNHQWALLELFIEIQMQAATVNGKIHPNKLIILQRIQGQLGVSSSAYYYQYQSRGSHGSRQHYQQTGASSVHKAPLADAYRILEVDSKASNEEVTKAYRRKMSKNHPDRLVSQGLPEEMIKLATQKTQQIKAAYDDIKQARGF